MLSIDDLVEKFRELDYIIDETSATPIFLALGLGKPLLIEGPPGSGKTEIAKVVSKMLGRQMIHLQCYEGLDYNHALYEWDSLCQLLEIKLQQHDQASTEKLREEIYSEKFLLKRPLLKSIRSEKPTSLLIDEIDRSDAEFEGFLLEILSEFQVTVLEFGRVNARSLLNVFITQTMRGISLPR